MLDLKLSPRHDEEEREEPRPTGGWSLLDLEHPAPPPPEAPPATDLFDIGHKPDRAFPIERAILASIAAHILVLLFVAKSSFLVAAHPGRGILGTFVDSERQRELDRKIPVIFRSAPGPARQNPKVADGSDATRRAGGGDPKRPRADTPFIPPQPGKEGLRPGDIAAQRRPQPAPSTGTGAQQAPAAASGQKAEPRPDAFKVPAPGNPSAGREGPKLADLDRAIKEAAKGVGATSAGEQGAGFPNPEGGFVDSGPISFDTTWYDWGPYAEEMVRRIKLHWEIPELARLGWKGKLTIRFFIRGDGRVEGARILSVSGVPPFDNAALQAILTSSPFRPLPKDLGSDREGVTVTFFYNMRPDRDGQRGGER